MPPRQSSYPTKGAFYPPNDTATHRDLVLFEERLKTVAASLTRRKHRYQFFLAQLVIAIIFLLCEVVLHTDFLVPPCHWAISLILPEDARQDAELTFHHYLTLGLLCISVTTLVLFFVSGMYSEKIAYANRYVPHANRALRNFNMRLNVRQPSLWSRLPFSVFAFLFPRTYPSQATSPTSRRRSPSPAPRAKRSSSVPIPPMPPSSNPRGELIFSSRVDRAFREAYERHRAIFERMKEERAQAAYQKTWIGWLHMKLLRIPPANIGGSSSQSGTATPSNSSQPLARSSSGTGKGKGSGSRTPSGSRRSSPVPGKTPKVSSRGNTPSPLSTGESSREDTLS
ncbi:hypothetical protein K474DRAFT_1771657 [Panus rudis PR-1116 ss-1]|nr:hypothetical protein K474DRAFT_1771657 [Panus rudis PR-1116 ss-1]